MVTQKWHTDFCQRFWKEIEKTHLRIFQSGDPDAKQDLLVMSSLHSAVRAMRYKNLTPAAYIKTVVEMAEYQRDSLRKANRYGSGIIGSCIGMMEKVYWEKVPFWQAQPKAAEATEAEPIEGFGGYKGFFKRLMKGS
ncbi:MAG: hypothetical protein JKY60_16570 [Kordiimonadaceae bacterium]|nr:hypothetical protein [Kordiimonadaceae bacterium]